MSSLLKVGATNTTTAAALVSAISPLVVNTAPINRTYSAAAAFPRLQGLRRVTSGASLVAAGSKVGNSPVSLRFVCNSGENEMPKSWLSKLGFRGSRAAQTDSYNSPAHGPDDDKPAPGQQFATFGAGCFWGVELAFQRVPGVTKTEVGYTQGLLHSPSYGDVCEGDTGHSEVVRVQYDPNQCSFESLLDVFWGRHDPTTLNRQGGDVGSQYRSGIYFYTPEQEKAAKDSKEAQNKLKNNKIVTEILPAKKFYRAEEYHQQYLAKGGRFGFRQSTDKGCNDPIRCYG